VANLQGAYLKLDWVDAEMAALDEEIRTWGEANGYTTTSDFYPEVNVVAIRVEFATPPPIFGVRFGNVIHCCRSALDYLVTDLVLLNENTPSEGPGGNQFPIYTEPLVSNRGDPVTFAEKTVRSLAGVHPDHVAMIEALQPYRPENYGDGTPNPLAGLAELSNIDKHRVLHTLAAGLAPGQEVDVIFAGEQDVGHILKMHPILIGPHVKAGAVLGCAEIVPCGPEPKMHIKAQLPTQLIFDGDHIGSGYAVWKSLANVADTTRAILDWFKPLFSGGVPGERPGPQPPA